MTKEECIGLLKRYAEYNGIGIPNLVGCREAMRMAAELLERPSLPSNLDEAAEEWCKRNNKGIALCADKKSYYLAEGVDAFKAGAEWMAGQGSSYNTEVGWIDGPTVLDWPDNILDGFKVGDKVVVQIRKR